MPSLPAAEHYSMARQDNSYSLQMALSTLMHHLVLVPMDGLEFYAMVRLES